MRISETNSEGQQEKERELIEKIRSRFEEIEELSIYNEYPNSVYRVSSLPALVKISLDTKGGIDDGAATCHYAFGSGESPPISIDGFVMFVLLNTVSGSHVRVGSFNLRTCKFLT